MRRVLAALLALIAAPAAAVTCRDVTFDEVPFTVCEASAEEDLRLFLDGSGGERLGTFAQIERQERRKLLFAMNAGMYGPDRGPIGLYIEAGEERHGIVTREGPGNFGLLPNGVFCWGEGRAAIIESRAFAASPPACDYATQSGPMLVLDGKLHPRFLPDSSSRYIRNGVGVMGGRILFAISNRPVTFHLFARLFRDGLGARDALYLDGSVSRLHAPALGRSDFGRPMGPIVGIVAPVDEAGGDR